MRRIYSQLAPCAKSFTLGILVCLAACSAAGFKYYGLDGVDYRSGTLLGPKPKDDLPFYRCEPDASKKHKCVIMFTADFFALKQDYEDVKMRLKACEKP